MLACQDINHPGRQTYQHIDLCVLVRIRAYLSVLVRTQYFQKEHCIDGLNFAAPNRVAVAVPLLLTLADGILSSLPSILSAGHEILMTLVSGLTQAAPELLTRLAETTVLIAQSFTENAPVFLETAVSLGEALFGGVLMRR